MSYFTCDASPELNFSIRTRVFLNEDVITSAGDIADDLGIRKALLVTGRVTAKTEIINKVGESLRRAGVDSALWDKVEPDPPEASIEACTQFYRASGCDGLIAVGGGSSMDTAKMAACLASGGGSIREYDSLVQERQVPDDLPPLICAPTTSGTGSEVTSMAVFSSAEDNSKRIITGLSLCPRVALVDPKLTYSMPPALTAATGMDALSHAVEAYLSTMSNPISDALSLYAMELIAEFLPRAVKEGQDEEARASMSVAATMAGMAINHAMPHFAHAIGHALGARYNLAHGVACGMVLAAGLRKIKEAKTDRFEKIARAFAVEPETLAGPADAAVDAIDELTRQIGLPALAETVGGREGELAEVAAASAMEPAMMFSPVLLTEEDVREILGLRP